MNKKKIPVVENSDLADMKYEDTKIVESISDYSHDLLRQFNYKLPSYIFNK